MNDESKYSVQLVSEYRDEGEDFQYQPSEFRPKTGSALRVSYHGMSKAEVVIFEQALKRTMDALFAIGVEGEFGDHPDQGTSAMLAKAANG